MSKSVVITEDSDVVTIILNREQQLNSFSVNLVDELHTALDKLDKSSPKLAVFRANGKGFSGGLDLSGLDSETDGDLLLRLVKIEQLLARIRHAKFATMALVHGACYGAAADLVLACRTRVATADARFLMPGMRFGIVLGTRRLRDTIGENNAYQLLDRIKPFKAEVALDSGFITAVAERAEWPDVIAAACDSISGFSKSAYATRVASLTPDTRAADMHALVTSVTKSSIKKRLLNYVDQMQAK